MVVTVQVQLLVPELTVTLSDCVDSGTFSGRNQSIDSALARVTITHDYESEHLFYLLGKFHRICAGH